MSFLGYFSSLGGLSALNVLVTDWLVKVCKVQKGWVKQLISWVVPVVLSVLGLCLGLGLFASYGALTAWTSWVYTILTGVGVGLVSNGLYDISGVQTALNWITDFVKTRFAKKQEAVAETTTEAVAEELPVEEHPVEELPVEEAKADADAKPVKRTTRKTAKKQ